MKDILETLNKHKDDIKEKDFEKLLSAKNIGNGGHGQGKKPDRR